MATHLVNRPMSANMLKFIDALMLDPERNQRRAHVSAYGKKKGDSNASAASQLMKDPRVRAEIKLRQAEAVVEVERANGVTPAKILLELSEVIKADPRELMEYHRGACRYCHGAGFLYHRTPAEFRRDLELYKAHDLTRKGGPVDPLSLAFDVQGGVGFNPTVEPHPDCPECFGRGEGYTHIRDTRKLSSAAARLFVGVKQTDTGLEVKTRAVDKSIELFMRHAGMLDKDKDSDTAEQKAAAIRALCQALGGTTGGPTK